jgi:type VII secretion protein EccE
VGVAQILVLEAVGVLILAAFTDGSWLLASAMTLGLLLATALFSRLDGRWLTEIALLWWELRRRAAAAARRTPAESTPSVPHALAPDLTSQNTVGSDGAPVGVGSDGAGWFASIMVAPPRTPPQGQAYDEDPFFVSLPLDAMTKVMAGADLPGWTLQVVVHNGTAPGAHLGTPPLCTQSYTELARSVGVSAATSRYTWVVARLDARRLAEAGLSAAEATRDAPGMLVALVRKLCRVLHQAGLTFHVLDAAGVVDALNRSLSPESKPGPAPEKEPKPESEEESGAGRVRTGLRRSPREEWTAWYSPTLAHVSFWLRNWPAPRRFGAFVDRLADTKAVQTSVALMCEPGRHGLDLRCLIRITARPAEAGVACAELQEAASAVGVRLLRLDGEHGPAAFASAPSGGGSG